MVLELYMRWFVLIPRRRGMFIVVTRYGSDEDPSRKNGYVPFMDR